MIDILEQLNEIEKAVETSVETKEHPVVTTEIKDLNSSYVDEQIEEPILEKPKKELSALQKAEIRNKLSGDNGEKAEMKANDETKEIAEQFITELTDLEVKKALIMQEIKDLKSSYKENGIAVAPIVRAFKTVQKDKKKTDPERFEDEVLHEWFTESKIIDDACLKLQK